VAAALVQLRSAVIDSCSGGEDAARMDRYAVKGRIFLSLKHPATLHLKGATVGHFATRYKHILFASGVLYLNETRYALSFEGFFAPLKGRCTVQ